MLFNTILFTCPDRSHKKTSLEEFLGNYFRKLIQTHTTHCVFCVLFLLGLLFFTLIVVVPTVCFIIFALQRPALDWTSESLSTNKKIFSLTFFSYVLLKTLRAEVSSQISSNPQLARCAWKWSRCLGHKRRLGPSGILVVGFQVSISRGYQVVTSFFSSCLPSVVSRLPVSPPVRYIVPPPINSCFPPRRNKGRSLPYCQPDAVREIDE